MVNYKDVLTGVGAAFAALLLRDIVRTAIWDRDNGTVDFNLAGDPIEGLRLGELDDVDWHRGVDLNQSHSPVWSFPDDGRDWDGEYHRYLEDMGEEDR